ncbi:MAG TPA: carboxypeptidase regulatory-like domain-containing protein, partial [Kofleriaceae bacterium]|nr:carboxypeptidase regulatory-like domain-containing protein [Kofleriaceae bacterium]
GSVLEATAGGTRGAARVDRAVTVVKSLRIQLARPATLATTITGHVRDPHGAPIGEAQVAAVPTGFIRDLPDLYAVTGPDGGFTLTGVVEHSGYDLFADSADHVRGRRNEIHGGGREVDITVDAGVMLAGQVVDAGGVPIPQFALLARHHAGAARVAVVNRAIVDPHGRFAVRVPAGDYDLIASARGRAASPTVQATAGAGDARIVIGAGVTVRGTVVSRDDHAPIGDAMVARETIDGFPHALPGDVTTLTRADGTFMLTGLPAGSLSLRIGALNYRARIETITGDDGAELGPLTLELAPRDPDDSLRSADLTGIGASFMADGDVLRIIRVIPNSSAFDAGLGFGDIVTTVDGQPVARLGLEGALARLRGPAGTTARLTVRRAGHDVPLVLERRALRS